MSREKESGPRSHNEPIHPTVLPPVLAEFLKDKPMAALLQSTDGGTVVIIKAPSDEIRSLIGPAVIHLRHQLYEHPAAPVIRTVLTIFDQPDHPLTLEMFTNVADQQQRDEFAALSNQQDLSLLLFDEEVHHRLSKRIHLGPSRVVERIVRQAERYLGEIPEDRFDFDQAKADIMANTNL